MDGCPTTNASQSPTDEQVLHKHASQSILSNDIRRRFKSNGDSHTHVLGSSLRGANSDVFSCFRAVPTVGKAYRIIVQDRSHVAHAAGGQWIVDSTHTTIGDNGLPKMQCQHP
jgi:hypothetical protein